MAASLSAVARHFDFVRETDGPNKGVWVNLFQRFTGNGDGDSWCASFISFCLNVAYRGASPLVKSGAAHDLFAQCQQRGWLVAPPQPDDLYFYLDANGHAHHVGVITRAQPLIGLAGNTSPDGTSSNGTGVFEHAIPATARFARLPQ